MTKRGFVPKNPRPIARRFAAKVDFSGDCWLWIAAATRDGYGTFEMLGKSVYAHRFSYELLVGPIAQSMTLDHLCRNKRCVNPAHLEPVTRAENVRRGWADRPRNDKSQNARAARGGHGLLPPGRPVTAPSRNT